uniref:Prion protein b n=1 Tax=Knipowitschia caucasica TaxID=637954 RepID=A0AAV2IWT3_KNICA
MVGVLLLQIHGVSSAPPPPLRRTDVVRLNERTPETTQILRIHDRDSDRSLNILQRLGKGPRGTERDQKHRAMMHMRGAALLCFFMGLLCFEATAKKGSGGFGGGGFGGGSKKTPTNKWGTSKPFQPNRKPNPYPAGGSYPGAGNTNPGGNPRQNQPAGGYPRQNQPAGGYPNQNPAGGYPNQNPAGGYPRQNQPAGGYPAGGGYPNQNPAGGYPRQNPGGYPAAGGYPAGGGYPAAGGYPAGGGYPVRGGNTGQGWGAPGGSYPGGYPGGGMGGGYPNWNPNNKILSPRYGTGSYGGYGAGGSPFARSASSNGFMPKPESRGFAKKAMLAAGVGAMAGMAVGYGLGRFPRPHFPFRNQEEEHYYNNYMYRRYGSQSTDQKDYGRDYEFKPPPRAQTYEAFMARCMNQTDLLKDKEEDLEEEDRDAVSIQEVGYPALVEQMTSRRCVEKYMVYSEQFLQKRSEAQVQNSVLRVTSALGLLSCMLLLH